MKFFTLMASAFFFVTDVMAQEAAAPQSGGFGSFIPLIFILVLFYFLMIRPQLKQQKEHDAMVGGIKRADKVILNSGIEAVVSKVDEANKRLLVKIADGVEVSVVHDGNSIREVISLKPANENKKAKNDDVSLKPKATSKSKPKSKK